MPWLRNSLFWKWMIFHSTQSVQFNRSCLTFCDPMDCTTPGFPVHHQLLELPQTHVHCVSDAIQLSCPLSSPSLQSSPASGSFPVSQLFASGGQNIWGSGSTSVLPTNIQSWFPLGLTGLLALLSKGLWRVFSNILVQTSIIQYSVFYIVHLSFKHRL